MQCIKPLLTVMKVCCHTSFDFCKEMNEKKRSKFCTQIKDSWETYSCIENYEHTKFISIKFELYKE